VSGVPVGHKAVGLAWLPPSAEALLALTADPPDVRVAARDPAVLAHVLRFARPTPDPQYFALTPALLSQPSLCSNAAYFLEHCETQSASEVASPNLIDQLAYVAANVATELASRSELCSPAAAFAVARLSPLGWYAIQATDRTAVDLCLLDPCHCTDPEAVERQRWGLSASAVARRLSIRWRLPSWVSTTVGLLRLNSEDAVAAGALDGLFRVVQTAVAAAERVVGSIGLTDPSTADVYQPLFSESVALAEDASKKCNYGEQHQQVPIKLLIRLLRATAQARRASGTFLLADCESQIDHLTGALAELRADIGTRVRDAKLASLAEFAAGASHEINNPIAVIRGHAQLLLNREDDPVRRGQLEAIVRQTRRVHDLLQGTLQFARPPRPQPTAVPLNDWLISAIADMEPDADARGVTLIFTCPTAFAEWSRFDPIQIRQALDHLVCNAIEAVPNGGWVRVRLERWGDSTAVSVEDCGPGPSPEAIEHLFDPFYSGRTAGRGRGLGLAIAWRLARLNGCDVRYDPAPGGPTRFVLILPSTTVVSERISA
jgi:two-component system NtrC family sensor kinase